MQQQTAPTDRMATPESHPVTWWLTLPQLQERWQVSRWTIYRLMERGELGGARLGNRWRVKVEEAERYELSRRFNVNHPAGYRQMRMPLRLSPPKTKKG